MKGLDRDIFAHLVVAVGLCVGAWFMFVEPIMRSAADEAGFVVDVRRSGLAGLDEASLLRMTNYVDRVRGVVREVRQRSAFAGDTTGIYTNIMETAEAMAVDVDRITPIAATGGGEVAATGFDIAVRGNFARVADFIGAVDDMEGFVRVRRVALGTSEVDGKFVVDATITCDAFAVKLPSELAAMIAPEPSP